MTSIQATHTKEALLQMGKFWRYVFWREQNLEDWQARPFRRPPAFHWGQPNPLYHGRNVEGLSNFPFSLSPPSLFPLLLDDAIRNKPGRKVLKGPSAEVPAYQPFQHVMTQR